MKGQTFTPANSKRGRQYTAAKGTGDGSSEFASSNQIAWNKLIDVQRAAKKQQKKSAG